MKSIKKLNQKLQKIEKIEQQMKKYKSVGEIPIIQFLIYKNNIHRRDKICKEIEQVKRYAKGSKLLYEYEINCWIENPNINCREYSKLEAKAKYRRNLKLYKCGYLEKKPTLPFIQKFQSKFEKISWLNNVLFQKINNKIINFNSNVLPHKINKIAVNSAKLCIQGVKKVQSECNSIKAYVASKDSIKYIRNVFKHASNQLAYSNETPKESKSKDKSSAEEYRASLKAKLNSTIKTPQKENKGNKNATIKRKNLVMEHEL